MSCPLALEVLAGPWNVALLRVDFRQNGRGSDTCATAPALSDSATVLFSIRHVESLGDRRWIAGLDGRTGQTCPMRTPHGFLPFSGVLRRVAGPVVSRNLIEIARANRLRAGPVNGYEYWDENACSGKEKGDILLFP